jgi:hypothetical protein
VLLGYGGPGVIKKGKSRKVFGTKVLKSKVLKLKVEGRREYAQEERASRGAWVVHWLAD